MGEFNNRTWKIIAMKGLLAILAGLSFGLSALCILSLPAVVLFAAFGSRSLTSTVLRVVGVAVLFGPIGICFSSMASNLGEKQPKDPRGSDSNLD